MAVPENQAGMRGRSVELEVGDKVIKIAEAKVRLEVVPFRPEHLEDLKRSLDDRAKELLGDSAMGSAVKDCLFTEYAKAVLKDGECIGAAGIFPFFGDVGFCWLLVTPELRKHPFFLVRWLRRSLEEVGKGWEFERIETLIVNGFKAGVRLAECLGFTPDGGGMQGFGPRDEDFIKYVRVFRCIGISVQEMS